MASMSLTEFREIQAKLAAKGDQTKKPTKPKAQIVLSDLDPTPNATEARYKTDHLCDFPEPDHAWLYERHTFRLSNGTIYTPDWTVWQGNACVLVVEVKGSYIHRDSSKDKFRLARKDFTNLRFQFAQWRGSQWCYAE